jgi:hypothetical protein
MRVECPHCHVAYRIEHVEKDTVLVCHRCGAEFGFGISPADMEQHAISQTGHTLHLFPHHDAGRNGLFTGTPLPMKDVSATGGGQLVAEAAEPEKAHGETPDTDGETLQEQPYAATEDSGGSVEKSEIMAAPVRKEVSVWPWLFAILLLIASAGFWFKHEAWLDNVWLRSLLINSGLPVQVRDKDWRVAQDIQAQWIKRNNGSYVLVVEGRVDNLLQCELRPPAIRFSLYSISDPGKVLLERVLPISQPPLLKAIKKAPFVTPPEDRVPVPPLGDRGFILVLEDLPKDAGEFTLSIVAAGT